MKHVLFLGAIFFFFNGLQSNDLTLDEIETEREIASVFTSNSSFKLPDMNVKFDIFVADDAIFYEMPRFYLNEQEVKCEVCGQCPVMIQYKKDKLTSFCLQHAPRK